MTDEYEYLEKKLRCSKCNEVKSLVHFQGYHSNYRELICGSCGRRKYNSDEQRKRRAKNKLFKFKGDLRARITQDFKKKGYSKNSKTEQILGCSFDTLKKHFESKFTDGMNWDNQGEWHIDHIIPLATAKTKEDVIRLNHYTNLQPLWAEDNLKKGSKILE